MKELLSEYMKAKEEFDVLRMKTEVKFGKYLESIPGWRDRLGNIIGMNYGEDLDPDDLIPEIRDLWFSGEQVHFKIRIPSDTWVKEFVEVGPIPFDWLTSYSPSPEYLEGKLKRRQEYKSQLQEELQDLQERINSVDSEINLIQGIIKKG